MSSRTCREIVDPRYDTECGLPSHLETNRCIQHLPEAEPPKVAKAYITRGQYNVGIFCTYLQRWEWETVSATSLKSAKTKAPDIIARLLHESADRWAGVSTQAAQASAKARQRAHVKPDLK